MKTLIFTSVFLIFSACSNAQTKQKSNEKMDEFTITKTDEEWKKILTPEEFQVLRNKGTERAFTGKYYEHKENGVYACKACKTPLFASDTKYNSGSGWPSFYDVIEEGNVKLVKDTSYGMIRVEVICNTCGGHLGHVFDDGPNPTGLRYCINSVSLDFQKK